MLSSGVCAVTFNIVRALYYGYGDVVCVLCWLSCILVGVSVSSSNDSKRRMLVLVCIRCAKM